MRGIFFIVGTGRCGTNLCRAMLDLHPALKVVTETHFIPTLFKKFGENLIGFDEFVQVIGEHYTSSGKSKWIDKHLEAGGRAPEDFPSDFKEFCSPDEERNIKDFIEAFFEFCYGDGDYLLGDKTPQYGLHMSKLVDLWPDAKFIHMVRDGRYAATSIQNHNGIVRLINAGFPNKMELYSYKAALGDIAVELVELSDCAGWWQDVISTISKESKNISSSAYTEIHYEDLLLYPVRELKNIAEFLGVHDDWKWLLKAVQIPHFTYLLKQRKRVSRSNYDLLTSQIKDTLRIFDYPTKLYKVQRGIRVIHWFKIFLNWLIIQVLLLRLFRIYISVKMILAVWHKKS